MVRKRGPKYFTILKRGNPVVVSIDRLKPVFVAPTDLPQHLPLQREPPTARQPGLPDEVWGPPLPPRQDNVAEGSTTNSTLARQGVTRSGARYTVRRIRFSTQVQTSGVLL